MFEKRLVFVATAWLLFSGVSIQAQQSKKHKPGDKVPVEELTRRESTATGSLKGSQFIAGGIIYADGTPADATTQVELVCRGEIMARAVADVKGQFSLVLSSRKSVGWLDASVRHALADHNLSGASAPRNQLSGCEVRVPPQAGVVSNSIRLSGHELSSNPFVGVIVLQRLSYQGGTIVSLRSMAAPSKARRAFEKAQKELHKEKVNHSKVTKELEKAIKRYPEYAEAWYLLGQVRLSQKDAEGAREAFRSTIEADERYIAPYLDLAGLELGEQRFEEAVKLTDRLMELSPQDSQVLFFDGLAKYSVGDIEAAEKSLRAVVKSPGEGTKYPATYFYLGLIELQRRQLQSAAGEFRRYLRTAPASQVPLERREELTKKLALWEEHGLIEKESLETEVLAPEKQLKAAADSQNSRP
jgi:TolA-binding protein